MSGKPTVPVPGWPLPIGLPASYHPCRQNYEGGCSSKLGSPLFKCGQSSDFCLCCIDVHVLSKADSVDNEKKKNKKDGVWKLRSSGNSACNVTYFEAVYGLMVYGV